MGNRQQSRFLALVSSYDRLKELSAIAADSENTSQLQYLKTLDSVEAKQQQLKTSMQSLYTDTGIEQSYKAGLDFANNYIKMLNKMGTGTSGFLKAISQIGMTFYSIANVVTTVFGIIRTKMQVQMQATSRILDLQAKRRANTMTAADEAEYQAWLQIQQRKLRDSKTINQRLVQDNKDKNNQMTADDQVQAAGWRGKLNQAGNWIGKHSAGVSMGLNAGSLALSTLAMNTQNQQAQGWLGTGSTTLSGAAMGLQIGGLHGAAIGGILGLVLGLFQNIGKIAQSETDKLKELQEKAAEASNKALEKQADTKILGTQIAQLRKLEAARYDSVEAEEAYYEAANQMAEKYPYLIKSIDTLGNATIDLSAAQDQLTKSRRASVKAAQEAAIANYKQRQQNRQITQKDVEKAQNKTLSDFTSALQMSAFSTSMGWTGQGYDPYALKHLPDMETVKSTMEGTKDKNPYLYALFQAWQANDFDTIQQLLSSKKAYNNRLKNYNPVNDIEAAVVQFFSEWRQSAGGRVLFQQASTKQQALEDKAARKSDFLSIIGSSNYSKENEYSYLANFSQSSELLASMAEKKYQEFLNGQIQTEELYTQFINALPGKDYLQKWNKALQDFWDSLSKDQQINFPELIKNAKTRTSTQMKQQLTATFGMAEDLASDMVDILYPQQIKDTNERLVKRLQQRKKSSTNAIRFTMSINEDGLFKDDWYNELGESEKQKLLDFYDMFQTQVDKNIISQTRGETIFGNIVRIAKQIVQTDLTDAQKQQAEKILYNWTDWTKTGIEQLGRQLTEAGVQDVDVSALANSVAFNLNSIILQIENTISDTVKNYEEAISQATSGMSTDKALEFAAKNGMQLSDLQFRAGKWYADSIKLLTDMYEDTLASYDQQLTSLNQSTAFSSTLSLRFKGQNARKGYKQLLRRGTSQEDVLAYYSERTGLQKQELDVYLDWLKANTDLGFQDWIESQKANIEKMSTATKYFYGNSLLQAGHVDDFMSFANQLTTQTDYDNWDDLVEAYSSGTLDPALNMFDESIQKYLENGAQAVYDAATYIRNGGQGTRKVTVTENNKDVLKQLFNLTDDQLVTGQEVGLNRANFKKDNIDSFRQWVADNAATMTEDELNSAIKFLSDWSNDTQIDLKTWESIVDSFEDGLDESEWGKLPAKIRDTLFVYNSAKKKWVLKQKYSVNALLSMSDNDLEDLGVQKQDLEEFRAYLKTTKSKQNKQNLFKSIAKNHDKLGATEITQLQEEFDLTYQQLATYLQDNGDGTFSIDLTKLIKLVQDNGTNLSKETIDYCFSIIETNFNSVMDLFSQNKSGYKSQQDVQPLLDWLQEDSNNRGMTIDQLTQYNQDLHAWQLSGLGTQKIIQRARKEIKKAQTAEQEDALKDKLLNDLLQLKEYQKFAQQAIQLGVVNEGVTEDQIISYIKGQKWEDLSDIGLGTYIDELKDQAVVAKDVVAEKLVEAASDSTHQVRIKKTDLPDLNLAEYAGIVTELGDEYIVTANAGNLDAAVSFLKDYYQSQDLTDTEIANKLQEFKNTIKPDEILQIFDMIQSAASGMDTQTANLLQTIYALKGGEGQLVEWDESIGAYVFVAEQLQSFIDKISGDGQQVKEAGKKLEETNRTLIKTGQLSTFLSGSGNSSGYNTVEDLFTAYQAGTIDYSSFGAYANDIYEYLTQGTSSVIDTYSKLFSGQITQYTFRVDPSNIQTLKAITGNAELKIGQYYTATAENAAESWDEVLANIANNPDKSPQQKRKEIVTLWNERFSDRAYDAVQKAIESADSIDISTWLLLPEEIKDLGMVFNDQAGTFSLNLNAITDDMLRQVSGNDREYNELKAKLEQQRNKISPSVIFADLIKNRDSLSTENIASIANSLQMTYDQVIEQLHAFRNDDGTYRVDISRIRDLMREKGYELTDEMQQMIADSLQESVQQAQNAVKGLTEGYTNVGEMQKLMNQLEQAGMGLSFDQLFTFDKSLGAYFISAQGLFRQLVLARQQLEGGTAQQQAAAQQLINDVDRQLKQSIDISNLISASTIDKETSDNFSRAITNYNNYLLAMGKETQYNATALQDALLQGGQVGIEAAQAIADITGKELSAEDIATLYKKPAERMRSAMEQLTAEPGAIIDKTTAELIQIGGGAVDDLGNGAYKVTQSATDLFAAYGALYNSLEATGQATIEELNNIVAKAYESKEKADVTSMMSGLTDMTYSTLANIFTAAGQRMTPEYLNALQQNGVLQKLGAGKIRVSDFSQFAAQLGINPTSEAYISAFRTYNDEMIKINQQVSTNIKNAANEVLGAQAGTQINLTDMYARLDYDGQQALIETLHAYGATLKNGILTIGDTAHLPEIYGEIVSLGAEVGALTEADIHEMNKNILKYHREHDLNTQVSSIISEMDKSTEDTIEKVAQIVGLTFEEAASFFTQGENGYFKLDHQKFRQALETQGKWEKLSLANRQAIENIINTQIDAAISMLDSVTSQNYTSMEDMRTVVNKLNQLGTDGGYQLTVDAIFDFDEALNSWRLNVYGIEAQVTAALAELKAAGASQKQIQGFQQRTLQTFARNIDVIGYINSADKGIDGEALRQAIEQYNAAARAFDDQLGINADVLIDALNAGGIDAMDALTILSIHTGQKFSSEDYLTAYQAGTEKFTEAFDSLHLSIGEIISDEAAEVLGLSSEVIRIEGTGHSLITNTVDLINSYDQLIARLANDPRTTLAQFNEAVVGKYEAEATSERTLASISNGMLDMNSFKERMTQLGYRVNDVMQAAMNADIANIDKASGNIKILDFDRFATEVLQISIWDKDGRYTQAYLDAKKAWNDAVIADITKTSDAIQSELNNLSNAQAGDYVNISTIWNSIAQTEQGGMAEILEAFGAEVRDGILYLSDRAAAQLPYITQLLVNSSGLYQTSQGNTLIANARKQAREGSVDNLYLDILKSRESLNEDNLLAIAQMFGVTYDSVANWLEAAKQGDGTYKLSVADVEALFEGRGLSDATKEFAKELIGSTIDNTISSLSGISTKVFNTSQMQATVKDLNSKVKGGSFETSDLFEFNKQLGGYVLTTKGVYAQFKLAAAEAAKAGPEAQRMLREQARNLLGDINIAELTTNLQQGNMSEQYASRRAFRQIIDKYNAAMQALGRNGLDSNILLQNLEQGGQQALAAARVIARAQGKKLSDSDITAIYQSRVNQLMQASDQLLNAGVGDIISSTAADMLGYAKIGGQRLAADGSAVLESADNLVDAYSKLYNELEKSGVATLAQLNQTMSRKLAKAYDKEHGINGVDYLSKAASLTYEEFGEMFTAAGVKLTDTMFEDLLNREIITETGGGTLRIENFDYIAKSLGIEQDSQAYTRAFKAYNDSLIELDTEVTNNILDEVKSVANAQAGKKSKINLTQLYTELDDTTRRALMFRLRLYGGYLSNGILTIQDNANIPALVQNIMSFAESNNLLLESELAELADTLNEIIKSYADTIAKALSSGLTNSEAATLTAQAKNWFGIDINFTKTYDGLKLSTDQANHLYQSLKSVDAAAANIVFEPLKESLTGANESLSSASGLAAAISRAEGQLADAADSTNQVLQERIALYKEIQVAQMDSAESYNFMGRSLPQGMQGVKNYWDSWGTAFKTLNEIANEQNKDLKSGETRKDPMIEIQDFYNMVTEMNNLAAMSGEIEFLGYKLDGSLESASKLINAGLSAISNVDGEGAKINLTNFGIDFSTGAAGMGTNIHEGIQQMAKSQIEMLDGLIQFLEAVVAMEQLGQLDTDFSGTFEFGELFTWTDDLKTHAVANEQAATEAAKVIEKANKQGNEELKHSLQQTKINGISLYQMLQDLTNQTELTAEQANLYTMTLSSLYQQLASGQFDPNKLGESVMQARMNSTVPLELNYGNKRVIFSQGVQLEWDEEKSQWRAPDGTLLGSDGPAAIEQWNAKRDAATVSAMLKGDTGDMTIELDDRTITVTQGLALVADNHGLFYVNGDYYNTPEQASAALAEGQQFNLEQDLAHSVYWQTKNAQGDPIDLVSLQGYTAEIQTDDDGNRHWVDTKSGRSYDSEQEWYSGETLQYKLNFGKLTGKDFKHDKDTGISTVTIPYGYGITVEMTETGELTYTVNGQPYTSRNEAIRAATKGASEYFKAHELFGTKNNFNLNSRNSTKRAEQIEVAKQFGLVMELKNDPNGNVYQVGNKKCKNDVEVISALSEILFDEDGNIVSDEVLESTAQVVTNVKVQNTVKISNQKELQKLTASQMQQVMDTVLKSQTHGELQSNLKGLGFSVPLDFDWEVQGGDAALTQGEMAQIISLLGGSYESKALSLSATFDGTNGDKLAKLLEESGIDVKVNLDIDDTEMQSFFERLKELLDLKLDIADPNLGLPMQSTTTYDGSLGDLSSDLASATHSASELSAAINSIIESVAAYPADSATKVNNFNTSVNNAGAASASAGTAVSAAGNRAAAAARNAASALNSIKSKDIDINLNIAVKSGDNKVTGTIAGKPVSSNDSVKVALTSAKGNALAAGKTLMGELGPELVVSNGRYFIVGQNGAEMVNLAPDAIVFNHLQTQQLLKNKRAGRGTPATNERNAVAYAKGSGPALVSASEALATLKQIRAMWQSMLNASMKDLGAMAGLDKGSSGGGGGGGGQDPEQIKAVIEEIERWYNLLRQIDKLEKDITYQESLQSKIESDRIANGQALYRSYKEELKALDGQIVRNQQLAELQQSWYERKRDEFTNSDYGKIFTYDENGLLQLQDGRNLGLDALEKLTARGIYGQTSGQSLNAKAQIEYLKSIGFNTQNLKYNDDGTTIDASSKDYKDNPDQIYEDMMQNFWDNLDGWKDELDSIYDSYHDQLNNVLSNESKRNQLLQKIIDNQLSVEQDVLKAIESREQKLIDELQDERDAFDKSNKDFLDGLNDQLNQQKQMYQNQESEKELVKLRRQLAILQRSGGSGSQIRSLQDQIAAKEQDQYFTAQQQQIANIQKAADLQIKRMDSQIELMTQTLEYQKQHGLLWQEVYEVMAATPEQIRQFIMENTPDFQSASALDVAQKIRDIDLRINEWVAYRDDQNAPIMDSMFYDWDSYMKARSGKMGDAWSDELAAQVKSVFDEWLQKTGDINLAGEKADEILQEAWKQFHPDDKPIDFGTEETETTTQEEKKQQQYYRTYDSDHNTPYQDWLKSRQNNKKETEQAATAVGKVMATTAMDLLSKQFHPFIRIDFQETTPNLTGGFAKYATGTGDIRHFASGGMVDYTGPAWVDGTPERPEAFLDPDTTRLVRQDLLGRSNSLLSFARDMVQQLHGASYSLDTNNVTEQNGLNIEKIDVNVKVDKVANDYDARAMGNTVMNEILSIARKSGTRGLSRR